MGNNGKIYTIGHSNHEWQDFLSLLRSHNVDLLVDIRSKPYSRYVRWATKDNLLKKLPEADIDYYYLGDKLGGIRLSDMTMQAAFECGIDDLVQLLKDGEKAAIMCAEENPANCHRQVVSAMLHEKGFEIIHIRGDGREEKFVMDNNLFNQKFNEDENKDGRE
jgi:uncharacterized protein (DUF488 family)